VPDRAFVPFIGAEPNTDWLSGSGVALATKGFVLTGADATEDHRPLETSRHGVFALGGRCRPRAGGRASYTRLFVSVAKIDSDPIFLSATVGGGFGTHKNVTRS